MDFKVEISEQAENDIAKIYYINENANSEPAATVIHVAYGRRDLDEVLRN